MSSNNITRVRRLCHQLCFSSCVEDKRQGRHVELLRLRPHWSVLKKEEQIVKIDQGEKVPFDISLPLPEMPYNLAVDAFCPAARVLAKETLGWWIICENNWAAIHQKLALDQSKKD